LNFQVIAVMISRQYDTGSLILKKPQKDTTMAERAFKQDVLPFDAPEPVRKGRPRSEKSRSAIIKATNSLLLHMSVQELSIEAVAKKAKVGKTTIYRWWPNKTALVMETLISQPGMQTPLPTAKNNMQAMVMQLEKLIRLLQSKNGEIIAQLFSEAQSNAESQRIFEDNFMGPLIDAVGFSFEQGQKDKEFTTAIDAKMAVDMLCGPIFFRLMAHPTDFNDKFQNAYPREAVKLLKA
jgi:hypothetical protein